MIRKKDWLGTNRGGLQRDDFGPCWKSPGPQTQSRAQPDRSTEPPTPSAACPCYAGDPPCMPGRHKRNQYSHRMHLDVFFHYTFCALLSPHQYHVTRGDVHIRLSWLFAPGRGRAVSGGRAVLRPVAELGRHAADTGRVCAPPSAGSGSCCRPRHATAHPSNTILTAEGRFGGHVLSTELLNKVIQCMCLMHWAIDTVQALHNKTHVRIMRRTLALSPISQFCSQRWQEEDFLSILKISIFLKVSW